ncbi:hypothetical protein [Vibrio sp. Y184]|uniref:hypothetical protein n=1 Tax=Vibrio sp. Y184 TaxID=3074705 RepID=UPI002966902B|nr:hypothetical protein [Vibrio sp. Y184]MDW3167949.1 hypothetical protein [Vibrio sp. Y184]
MLKVFIKFRLYMVSMLKYLYFNCIKLDLNKVYLSDSSNIVVSLTTYGERVFLVHLTIKSILLQSRPPKKIYLWLSSKNFPDRKIPKSLSRLEKFGVSINFTEEDLKSYKKILYTYEIEKNNTNTHIVTADDDIYYPSDWLHEIESKIKESDKYVYCYRAQAISFKSNREVHNYIDWRLYNSPEPSFKILPTGVSGVCYPLNALNGVENRDFMYLCPTADDIWLKFITLKNGYKSKLVLGYSVHFTPVILPFSLPKKGLERENVINNKNTEAFNKCIQYFKFSKSDF